MSFFLIDFGDRVSEIKSHYGALLTLRWYHFQKSHVLVRSTWKDISIPFERSWTPQDPKTYPKTILKYMFVVKETVDLKHNV